MSPLGLADLIHPTSTERFMRDTWERAAVHWATALSGPDVLLDLEGFERLLTTVPRLDRGWLQFVRDGRGMLPGHLLDEQGLLPPTVLGEAFARGDTLYLSKAERLLPALGALCCQVEADLQRLGIAVRCPLNAHIFATPPDARGFSLHRDEHASLVVQLEGSKRWSVHQPHDRSHLPRRVGPVAPDEDVGTESSFTLTPGDVLYVPAHWPHEARSSNDLSLHLTLRIFPLRWLDLLEHGIRQDPRLAASVPPGTTNSAGEMVHAVHELLASPAFQDNLERAAGDCVDRFRAVRDLPTRNQLRIAAAARRVDLETVVTHTCAGTCTVTTEGDTALVAFAGGSIRGPAALAEAFEFIATRRCFRVAELPRLTGGATYDPASLVRRLVSEGHLTVEVSS